MVRYRWGFLMMVAHRRPVHAVQPIVQSAGVAEVVAGTIAAPQRRHARRTVDTLLVFVRHHVVFCKTNIFLINLYILK